METITSQRSSSTYFWKIYFIFPLPWSCFPYAKGLLSLVCRVNRRSHWLDMATFPERLLVDWKPLRFSAQKKRASKKGTELQRNFMSLSEGGLFNIQSCGTRVFQTNHEFKHPTICTPKFSIGTKNSKCSVVILFFLAILCVCVCPHALQNKDSTQQISGWIETASYLVEGKALASGVQNGLQHLYFCQWLSASTHMH